ncbi:hypothetical protein GE21DRAFT_1284586 [Neurospora crassa]|nr:hypothetical protein B1D4.250 [imported] - Neurospora crassa [Neurospora crassa]KHE85338.1 hypothetical protein GE21DRAFT_1284586 [Neurospora crassa]
MPLCGFGRVSHTIATLRKASTEARHNTAVLSHSRRIITPSFYFMIVTSMIAIRGVTKFEGGNRSALTPSPRVLPLYSPPPLNSFRAVPCPALRGEVRNSRTELLCKPFRKLLQPLFLYQSYILMPRG